MTSQNKFQIRVRLIDLVREYVQATCEPEPDGAENPLLQLLAIYRVDTIRRMKGQQGDLDYLFDELKVGVRLAGRMLEEIQESEADLLADWYYGCAPRNMMQSLYNLLHETALELSWSILAIEGRYPVLKDGFDAEREDYYESERSRKLAEEAERNEQG
jgi:hypothetical protein